MTFGLVALTLASALGQAKLDPATPYLGAKSNVVNYEIDYAVIVTAPYKTQKLRVWLPLPPSDACQTVETMSLDAFPESVTPKIGAEKVHGNRFAYFEFDRPAGAQMIRHKFKIAIGEMRWNLAPAKVATVDAWPKAFRPYLESDANVVVDARFVRLAESIVPAKRNAGTDLSDIMRYVTTTMRYSHAEASRTGDSVHALTKKVGNCAEYHGLCASMGRALGYPARILYGINPFPKNSPSHCKLEVYLPPYGWVPFDVSETQKLVQAIQADGTMTAETKERLVASATKRLREGFRDNTWFLQTRGTDYDLEPPASARVPIVRTIYAEADGVALPDANPANPNQREFSWMTMHRYRPDRVVPYPFADWRTLE